MKNIFGIKYCALSALDMPYGHNLGLHVSAIASHFDLGFPYYRHLQRPAQNCLETYKL